MGGDQANTGAQREADALLKKMGDAHEHVSTFDTAHGINNVLEQVWGQGGGHATEVLNALRSRGQDPTGMPVTIDAHDGKTTIRDGNVKVTITEGAETFGLQTDVEPKGSWGGFGAFHFGIQDHSSHELRGVDKPSDKK